MYTRFLPTPNQSILLFGPRGTGKSTWIRDRFPDTLTYDLLDTRETLRLSKDPHSLYRELATLSPGDWAVIDEVQKVPQLLDEVHRLIGDPSAIRNDLGWEPSVTFQELVRIMVDADVEVVADELAHAEIAAGRSAR